MQETRLVAGKEGVDKQIKWVTIVEVLEDIDRIQDGEFLITTGFNLLEDDSRMEVFHDLLRFRPISGVAIYTSFYMEKIPESFIELANEHYLPLIEIPIDINFSEITSEIMEQIINRQTLLLEQSENIHRELTSYVLNDKSLREVTKRLAQLTTSNIFIYNEFYDIIYLHTSDTEYDVQNIKKTTFSVLKQEVEISIAMQRSFAKETKENIIIRGLVITIYPIIAKQDCFGWIVMAKPENKLQQLDDIAIERTISIYALEFIKKQAVEEAQLRIQNNLLEDIFSQNYIDEPLIINQAWKLQYNLTLTQCVFHITFNNLEVIENHNVDRLYHLIKYILIQKNKQHIIQTKMHSIVLLTNVKGDTVNDQYQRCIQFAHDVQKEWQYAFPELDLIIGIGKPYERISELSKSAREAQYAVQLHKLIDNEHHLVHYQDLGMYDLLLEMYRKGVNLKEIYEVHVNEIIDKTNKKVDLIETIDIYFKHNQSIQHAAKNLYIHRHTLRYRLKQIEEKTGLNMKSTDDLLKLQLGIMAYKLMSILHVDPDE